MRGWWWRLTGDWPAWRRKGLAFLLGVGLAAGLGDRVLHYDLIPVGREALQRLLRVPLEQRFTHTEIGDLKSVTGILSLGGGDCRVREAGRLARLMPQARLVISDEAESLELLGGGIEPSRIELEDRSRTTWENALFAKQMAQPKPGERWLLVTSAVHMARATASFRAVGFEVEPWPVFDTPAWYLMYREARHEWLGLVYYRLLGRTREIFPAPRPSGISADTAQGRETRRRPLGRDCAPDARDYARGDVAL